MFIDLDFESEIPIYEQLKNQIVIGIAKKHLLPGERLPSVRSLASDIGINMHTVNKAYQQLKHEGFVLIHRQKGVMVNPESLDRADDAYYSYLHQILTPIIADLHLRHVSEADFMELSRTIFNSFKEGETNE